MATSGPDGSKDGQVVLNRYLLLVEWVGQTTDYLSVSMTSSNIGREY